MSDRPDPEVFAQAVSQLSEDDLAKQIDSIGHDDVLEQIFAGMQDAFRADKAKDASATIHYEIKADGDVKHWTVEVKDGSCKTFQGDPGEARITLKVGIVDFVRLIFNQVQGPQLFMRGRLKLKGDMMFAMQMQGWFDQPGRSSN